MTQEEILFFNDFDLELVQLYRAYAAFQGISETSLWIFQWLFDFPDGFYQKDLAEHFGLPLQTVNSCIKKMESEGLLTLECHKKSKIVRLTSKGEEACQKICAPLREIELKCIHQFNEEEQQMLLRILKQYYASMQKEFASLMNSEVKEVKEVQEKHENKENKEKDRGDLDV